MFTFKKFQKEDLARMALHTGGVLGWDTGLGKTIAMYIWPLLMVGLQRLLPAIRHPLSTGQRLNPAAAVLMVAPGDLHNQIATEGRELFKSSPTPLNSQADFHRLSTIDPQRGTRRLPPGYYLTSYTQLTSNGVAEFPKLNLADPARTLSELNGSLADVEEYYQHRGSTFQDQYAALSVSPHESLATVENQYRRLRSQCASEAVRDQLDEAFDILRHFHGPFQRGTFQHLNSDQIHYITILLVRHRHAEFSKNIGEARNYTGPAFKVRCVYSPALVDLAQDCFVAVVADEATKIKGEDTIIGIGTRQLNPTHRLVMSATPIKNRLPDIFRLVHWSTGAHEEAHARFPYPDSAEAREEFAHEFMISERNLTREAETDRRYVKLTPQICNVHRVWKIFASSILRRRKKDCGEEIVQKLRHVVRMPMGKFQAEVYRYHLEAKYRDHKGRPAIGAQLMALRIAAADPTSALLKRPDHDQTAGTVRSSYPMVPKLFSALGLIKEILERNQQVILFHTFHDSIDVMSARLAEAGVPHFVLDGRTSPVKRGKLAAQFKQQAIPVMLANSECMAVGHSFPRCNNVAHYSHPWALDQVLQSDDRVHRINSIRDVNSYRLICNSSIDPRMEAQAEEKTDAADLVLDGQLLQKYVEELNLAELLQNAWEEFNNGEAQLIDERELAKAWPGLRAELAAVAKGWNCSGVSMTADSKPSAIRHQPPTASNIVKLDFAPAADFADLPLFSAGQ